MFSLARSDKYILLASFLSVRIFFSSVSSINFYKIYNTLSQFDDHYDVVFALVSGSSSSEKAFLFCGQITFSVL